MQPSAPTDANGMTTAIVQTRDQTSSSTITSTSPDVSTGTPGVISWLPAQYESPFEITCYVISDERDFLETPLERNPPGLPGQTFHRGFLSDVKLQGSGQALDGNIIKYYPKTGRFQTAQCANRVRRLRGRRVFSRRRSPLGPA